MLSEIYIQLLNIYFTYSSLPIANNLYKTYIHNVSVKKELVNHNAVEWNYPSFGLVSVPCLKNSTFQIDKDVNYIGRLLVIHDTVPYFEFGYIKSKKFFNFYEKGSKTLSILKNSHKLEI